MLIMHTSEDVVYIRVIPLKELQQMQKQLAILALISPNLLNLLSITPSSRDYSLQVHPPVLYLQKEKFFGLPWGVNTLKAD